MLVGEGYWRQKPPPDYLAVLSGERGQYLDHRGNVQAGIDAGLIPMHAVTASPDEWDEYEWKFSRSIEAYAREQPDDPDVPAMLERMPRWRDAYLRWGRDTLGFGVYLFARPAVRAALISRRRGPRAPPRAPATRSRAARAARRDRPGARLLALSASRWSSA